MENLRDTLKLMDKLINIKQLDKGLYSLLTISIDSKFMNMFNIKISDDELYNYFEYLESKIKNNDVEDIFIDMFYCLNNTMILFSELEDTKDIEMNIDTTIKNNKLRFEIKKDECDKYEIEYTLGLEDYLSYIDNNVLREEYDLENGVNDILEIIIV